MRNLIQIFFLLLLLTPICFAQWSHVGLASYDVRCFAINNSNLYAGTDWVGAFLSTDDGTSWAQINNGLWPYVETLVTKDTNLFAGTDAGVFLSSNNGTSWVPVNNGLTGINVQSLAIKDNNLYAGTGDGIFLSTNNGSNWTEINNGLTSTYVRTLAVMGNNLFAGTSPSPSGGGIFLSTNNGMDWVEVNNGLTNLDVRALMVMDTNLFVGTLGGGVFLSTNNGTSWIEVNNGLTVLEVRAFAINGSNLFAGTVYGGVFMSTDNGASWTEINTGLTWLHVKALVVSNTYLFAGMVDGGVWRRPLSQVPVELSSFTSKVYGNVVELYWTTATETNNSGFEIQRKDSGVENQKIEWKSIGFVQGFGTIAEPRSYFFTDNPSLTLTNTFHYRLKQMDFDGSFEYSNEIEVYIDLTPKEFLLYQNYPNPFNPRTTISYSIKEDGQVTLKVYDILGTEIAQIVNERKSAGSYSVTFDASNLPSGIYLYELRSNGFVQTKKMILMK